MMRLAAALAEGRLLVLDGGLGSELEADGHDLADPLWSSKLVLDAPHAVAAVHRRYAAAGADILTAATYQASLEALERRGLSEARAAEVFRDAVDLARGEAAPSMWVAGSIGSYGAFLADGSEYRGDYRVARPVLARFHRPRVELLAACSDVLALETMPRRDEAELLVELVEARSDAEAWIGFACRDERHLASGERLRDALRALEPCSALVAVGINCTAPRFVAPLLEEARAVTRKPLVVYPNAHDRRDGRWCGSAIDPEALSRRARDWHARGARILGGCCRTGPAHVAALAALRDRLAASNPSR